MKTPLLLVLLFVTATQLNAQGWTYDWANGLGSSDEEEFVNVATSPAGEIYTAFTYEGALTVGGTSYDDPEDDGRDIVLVKYNADGDVEWTNAIVGGGALGNNQFGEIVTDIIADDSGVYVLGYNGRNPDLFGGAAEDFDMFIAKVNADGSLAWNIGTNGRGTIRQFTHASFSPSGKLWVSGIYTTTGFVLEVAGTPISEFGPFLLEIDPATGTLERVADGLPFRIDRMVGWNEDELIASAYYERDHHIARINIATEEVVWHHKFQDLTQDPRSRALGTFVNSNGEIEHVFKAGTSNDIDFGNGLQLTGGFNNFGVLMVMDSLGNALRGQRLFERYAPPMMFSDSFPYLQSPPVFVEALKGDDGDIYLAGTVSGNHNLMDGRLIGTTDGLVGQTGTGSKDGVVMRLDADFNIKEITGRTGNGRQEGLEASLLPDGDFVLVGIHEAQSIAGFRDTTRFGPFDLGISNGQEDVFIVRGRTGALEDGVSGTSELNVISGLYPNPANQRASLRFDRQVAGEVSIYDQLGRLCRSKTVSSHELEVELITADLAPGLYLISILTTEGRQTLPLTVAR